jgi:predicted dehydrogenase
MIRIGILGPGETIPGHVRLLSGLSGFEIVGYCAHPYSSGMAVKEKLPSFKSPGELLESVDAVDVIQPDAEQFDSITEAIRQTKHILIQNPLTEKYDTILSFRKLLAEAQGIIHLTQTSRYNPAVVAAMPYVKHPKFMEFRRTVPYMETGKGSLIMNYMIHDIDLALFVSHSSIRRISISGMKVVSDQPDMVEARIDFVNGSAANFMVTRVAKQLEHSCEFYREGTRVSIDLHNQHAEIAHIRMNSPSSPDTQPEITLEPLLVTPEDPLQEEMLSFQTAIHQKRYPQANIEDALSALTIALELQEKLDRMSR